MSQPPGPQHPGQPTPGQPNPGQWGSAPHGAPQHGGPPQQGQPIAPGQYGQSGAQYPQYGAGPQQQWGQPPQPAKPRKAPKILMITGGVMMVIGIALAILLGSGIASSIPDDSEITRIGSGATVDVREHTLLYRPDGAAVNCRINGPAGVEPDLNYTGPGMSFTHGGRLYEAFGQLGGDDGPWGQYRVTCDNSDVIAAPPLDAGALGGGVLGIIGGVFLGGIGLILLIVGLIMHFVGRNKN